MSDYFQSNIDHLMTELRRTELRLQLKIAHIRPTKRHNIQDQLQWIYVSNQEEEAIIGVAPKTSQKINLLQCKNQI